MPPPESKPDLVAYIDGASRGNPGLASYGVIVENGEGKRVAEVEKVLGQATNNVAEYEALLAALDFALSRRQMRLKVISDSELLVRQITGAYKVKSADLKPLHELARRMIARLDAFSVEHVPRERNRDADRLANQALDAAETGSAFGSGSGTATSPSTKPLRVSATYGQGMLKPHSALPLAEGEEVELLIRRKKR